MIRDGNVLRTIRGCAIGRPLNYLIPEANSADAGVMKSVLACAHGVWWSTYEVYLAIGTAHGVHRVHFHIKRPRCSYITPGWTILVPLLRYGTHWHCWRMPSSHAMYHAILNDHSNSCARRMSRWRALTRCHNAAYVLLLRSQIHQCCTVDFWNLNILSICHGTRR